MKTGLVYLVGAGPGDPGLITVKGRDALSRADVVVYDYLSNIRLLELAPPSSKKIYVGKRGASHSQKQEDINALLVSEGQKGRVVVRLKGGDPFVFGRGGEEAEALQKAKVPFEVVPGVTSAIAVPAYAGIPVTHRDFTSEVVFVAGHEQDESSATPPHWKALAQMGTIVFLMSSKNLPNIVSHLVAEGRDPETPVAVIEWGTLPRQKKALGNLKTIVEEVKRLEIKPPTITVVGGVAGLADPLTWFENKPLFGKKILVTRARHQAGLLTKLLEEQGAQVFEIPTIEIKSPTSWSAMDRAIRSPAYDWMVFTSSNGVESFFGRFSHLKKDIRSLAGLKVAAIGPMTAGSLEAKGLKVDLTAAQYQAEGLIKALVKKGIRRKKILIVQAADAREILQQDLKKAGAKVTVVEAYRSIAPKQNQEELKELIRDGNLDLLTFASSTMIENFAKMLGKEFLPLAQKIPTAVIGPITAQTAKHHGLKIVTQPKKSTIEGLVEAILRNQGK